MLINYDFDSGREPSVFLASPAKLLAKHIAQHEQLSLTRISLSLLMNLELNEHQTKMVILALETAAFAKAKAASEHRSQYLITDALDLFFLAAKCRQGINWPEYDPNKNFSA